MTYAIRSEGLGKEYTIGGKARQGTLLIDQLAAVWRHPWRKLRGLVARHEAERFWAVKDLHFEVAPGEILGVVGRNGAGKSTLLKLLSRITDPSCGRALIRGRLASLLEVGTGFHPELSGRENIHLNATILGMRRREIDRKFNEIVDFSGVGRFLDTPVKHYSSGMYVRLAFAVAAHVEADILLVDEVLAVGDAEFQRRCLGKMGEVAQSGKTVVLVSHSLGTLARLCSRVLWLDLGKLRSIGEPAAILKQYGAVPPATSRSWGPEKGVHSTVEIEAVSVHSAGREEGEFRADEPFSIAIACQVGRPVKGRFGIQLREASGTTVLASASTDGGTALNEKLVSGEYRAICRLPAHLLAPGQYSVTVGVPDEETGGRVAEDVLSIEISEAGSLATRDRRPGVVVPLLDWEVTRRGPSVVGFHSPEQE